MNEKELESRGSLNFLQRASERIAHLLIRICMCSILAMMVLTVVDVCGRYFLNQPIRGAFELTEFMVVIAVASGLASTQLSKRHIAVEFVVARMSPRAQKVIDGFGYAICLGLYILISWQAVVGAQTQWRHGITSAAFGLVFWPFYLFLALGCGALCLVFLVDLLKLLQGKGDQG